MHPEKRKPLVATLAMEHMGGKQTIETGPGGNTYAYSSETPENGGVITSLIDAVEEYFRRRLCSRGGPMNQIWMGLRSRVRGRRVHLRGGGSTLEAAELFRRARGEPW